MDSAMAVVDWKVLLAYFAGDLGAAGGRCEMGCPADDLDGALCGDQVVDLVADLAWEGEEGCGRLGCWFWANFLGLVVEETRVNEFVVEYGEFDLGVWNEALLSDFGCHAESSRIFSHISLLLFSSWYAIHLQGGTYNSCDDIFRFYREHRDVAEIILAKLFESRLHVLAQLCAMYRQG